MFSVQKYSIIFPLEQQEIRGAFGTVGVATSENCRVVLHVLNRSISLNIVGTIKNTTTNSCQKIRVFNSSRLDLKLDNVSANSFTFYQSQIVKSVALAD